jgi:hypothetical protein
MSWWIKEHIAVNEDESKQLCSIEADNQTSLPAADQSATAGFIIVRGSSALVLDTGDRYMMNSTGTWIQQPSGVQLDLSGYATTQDLTDGLAGKVDTTTYTSGQAAQDAVIATKITSTDVFGLGTALTNGLDLNTVTGLGVYYAPSTTIAQSLINCPATFTFRMEVKTTNGSNRFMQTIYEVSTATGLITIYRRAYTVNGWQQWYRFDGVPV